MTKIVIFKYKNYHSCLFLAIAASNIFFLTGFSNECDGHVVKFTTENLSDNDDVEMQECGVTVAVSPVASAAIGHVYDTAFEKGNINDPVCYPNDVVNQYSANMNLELDYWKQRREKMINLYGIPTATPTSSAQNSGTHDSTNAGTNPSTGNANQNVEIEKGWEESIVTDEMIDIMQKYQSNKLPVDDIINGDSFGKNKNNEL